MYDVNSLSGRYKSLTQPLRDLGHTERGHAKWSIYANTMNTGPNLDISIEEMLPVEVFLISGSFSIGHHPGRAARTPRPPRSIRRIY